MCTSCDRGGGMHAHTNKHTPYMQHLHTLKHSNSHTHCACKRTVHTTCTHAHIYTQLKLAKFRLVRCDTAWPWLNDWVKQTVIISRDYSRTSLRSGRVPPGIVLNKFVAINRSKSNLDSDLLRNRETEGHDARNSEVWNYIGKADTPLTAIPSWISSSKRIT